MTTIAVFIQNIYKLDIGLGTLKKTPAKINHDIAS